MAKVRTIPATVNPFNNSLVGSIAKRKVAGYARVSTENEDQSTSYAAQVDYYTKYIKSRADWEFAGLYSDEGITATSVRKREGFKRMIEDALAGKIDLIITKSVSRFARNTVDSLTTIRKLKENNVECYFEKENIWTFDSKGELLITIMSSLAQEESRSISENTKWGNSKSFADGKVRMPYGSMLGYDKGPYGQPIINEEEAKVVKKIYKMFLEGMSYRAIARALNDEGIPTTMNKKEWRFGVIKNILTNEKYKGDALLQKTYTPDFLTKKAKKNHGEVPQYYVENSHEAIIDPRIWDLVQSEIKRREENYPKYMGLHLFGEKLKCAECGGWYTLKVWHSNDKYRREVYRCGNKYEKGTRCKTHHITEQQIKALFIKAVNQYLGDKEVLIENIKEMKNLLCSDNTLKEKAEQLRMEMDELVKITDNLVYENSKKPLDQEEYSKRYNEVVEEYDSKKAELELTLDKIERLKLRSNKLDVFAENLGNSPGVIKEFSLSLWHQFIEYGTVYRNRVIKFTFHDGTELTVE